MSNVVIDKGKMGLIVEKSYEEIKKKEDNQSKETSVANIIDFMKEVLKEDVD